VLGRVENQRREEEALERGCIPGKGKECDKDGSQVAHNGSLQSSDGRNQTRSLSKQTRARAFSRSSTIQWPKTFLMTWIG
jgi:hypothetical protein